MSVTRSCVGAFMVVVGVVTIFSGAAVADGPYCGVYCAFAALRLQGSSVELDSLLDVRYVPTSKGSRLEDLCRAIQDYGGQPLPMSGLGEAALRSSQDPIILHVRRPGYHADFAHWVLFLGSDGPTAHLLDPPGNAQDVPIAEIMAVWDGVGVVVTSGSWSGWEMKCGAWVVQGAILLGLAIATKAIRRIRWFRVIPQSAFLVVPAMALGSALAYHGSLASGFLRSPGAVGEVIRRNYEIDLPIVSAKDVSHLLSRPDVIIIDCRLEPAFRSGHIPGAVNLSVMANTWERLLVLDKIPMASQLIVYCQSDECEWAGQVAGDLFCRGFGNIAIFRGGWIGWKEYEHAPDFGR